MTIFATRPRPNGPSSIRGTVAQNPPRENEETTVASSFLADSSYFFSPSLALSIAFCQTSLAVGPLSGEPSLFPRPFVFEERERASIGRGVAPVRDH